MHMHDESASLLSGHNAEQSSNGRACPIICACNVIDSAGMHVTIPRTHTDPTHDHVAAALECGTSSVAAYCPWPPPFDLGLILARKTCERAGSEKYGSEGARAVVGARFVPRKR